MKRAFNKQDSKIAYLKSSIGSINLEHDEILDYMLHRIENENSKLKERCNFLQGEVRSMRIELLELQQYSRSNNIEVSGVPLTKGEDFYAILECMAQKLDISYTRSDFSIAHLVPIKGKFAHKPLIVAQFCSRSTRDVWLSAVKKMYFKQLIYPILSMSTKFLLWTLNSLQ